MIDVSKLRNAVRARIDSADRRTALRWATTALTLAVVLPFVVFAVPQLVGAEHSYVVLSGSMEPTISSGDVVVVNAVSADRIAEGDVITFGSNPNEPTTTHRVIGVEERAGERVFLTKGDNNENADPDPVPASAVMGRVMELPIPVVGPTLFVIPFIGYVIQFAGTSVGFVALVVAPLTLLAVMELWAAFGGGEADDTASSGAEDADGDDEAPPSEDPDAEAVLTLSPWQVAAATGLLAALAGVAGRYAYRNQESLAAVVAAGAAVAGLLLVWFTVSAGRAEAGETGDSAPKEGSRDEDDDPGPAGESPPAEPAEVIPGTVSHSLQRRDRVDVDSLSTLRDMADGRNSWIVHDASTDEYALLRDGVAYVASGTDDSSGANDERIKDDVERVDRTPTDGPRSGTDGPRAGTAGGDRIETDGNGVEPIDRLADGDPGRADRDGESPDPVIDAIDALEGDDGD